MYTAEDIRNITFTKSLGGYKTGEVDDFIDICADIDQGALPLAPTRDFVP